MENNPKILLVEDDQNFGDVLKSYLEMHDYNVTLATDGVAGMDKFRKSKFDLCILDVMMPKKDGFTLAKEIREKDQETPLIFLTAKTLKDDLLQGFKIGADDYITKPFNSEELLLRIQAILKRSIPKENPEDEENKFIFQKFEERVKILNNTLGDLIDIVAVNKNKFDEKVDINIEEKMKDVMESVKEYINK